MLGTNQLNRPAVIEAPALSMYSSGDLNNLKVIHTSKLIMLTFCKLLYDLQYIVYCSYLSTKTYIITIFTLCIQEFATHYQDLFRFDNVLELFERHCNQEPPLRTLRICDSSPDVLIGL